MNAFEVLQNLKNSVELSASFEDKETTVALKGSEQLCEAVISLPVDGKIRIVRVVAVDLGLKDGVKI